MDRYIAQRASQAFEALLSDEPLETRIKSAIGFLEAVNEPAFLSTLPDETIEHFTVLYEDKDDPNLRTRVTALRHAIEAIFEAWGLQLERDRLANGEPPSV